MNGPRRRFLALALVALVPISAVAATRRPLNPEQTMKEIERRLKDVREKIDEKLKNDPEAHRKAVGYISAAEAQFRKKKASFAGEPNYPIEAEYLGRSFKELILDSFGQIVHIMQMKDLSARKSEMSTFVSGADSRADAFDAKFQRDHPDDVRAAVTDRAKLHNWPPPDPNDSGRILDDFKKKAPLVATGGEIFDAVIAGTVLPDPKPTTPASPGGSSPNSGNGGASGPDWGSIIRHVATVGVPRELAASAGEALNAGRYAEARAMAGAALELDPKNRDALGVLHSAQGRSDGLGASAAAMTPARAGAAALAPGGFAGGGPAGAAGLSPEIAAAAASGAARMAAEQARGGAVNALKLGDAEGALDILSKALSQDPGNPALLNLRAQTYGRLGRWEEALKDAAAGLAAAPGNRALLSIKALAENRTRRYREALATSELMIAADPRSAWGYANRAHAWAGLGDRDAMLSDINRAAALDPRFGRAAADAARLQLPSDADALFLFPGEADPEENGSAAPAAPARAGRFGVVMGAAIGGGALLALGLLSLVLAPLKDSVVSVFTKAEPASVAGNAGLIRGQYEISRQIGAGGMGMVYEGTDRSLGRRVAIKKMREELRVNARERERFIIEAKTVASLHHPNIVDIYAIAEEGDDVYLVFEYVDGKTVHDLIQAGRLGVPEAISVTRSMGEALTYAHSRGVIHRDMKPSNVMLTSEGRVKVMDFGIARMAKDAMTRCSMTNTVVGTPPYMAPEQEQGVVRRESDVYSLAICAYEMLTGKLPFIGIGAGMLMNKINMSCIPPSRNIAGLPEALDDVFLKAFQADPERRYRTPAEFVTALSAAADGARSTTA